MYLDDERIHGVRLRELREAAGWSEYELARMANLSAAQVLELENGGSRYFYTARIKIIAASKVAQILGVPETELVRDPPPEIEPAAPEPVSILHACAAKFFQPTDSSTSWLGYALLLLIAAGSAVWWWGQTSASPKRGPVVPPGVEVPSLAPAHHPEVDSAVPAPASMVSSVTDSAPADAPCTFDGDMLVLQAHVPTQPSDKISLMLRKQGDLCVQDATGKVWREDLKPWLGRNYQGTAPWKLQSTALFGADVYFQGEKMIVPSDKVMAITLNGKAFNR